MPNPRRRHSKTRRDKRRTGDALTVPSTVECTQCHEQKLNQQVCPSCGYLNKRQIVKVKEA